MILSTSQNSLNQPNIYYRKLKRIYAVTTLFTLVFSTIYELNSHGILSPHMVGLALYPLVGGFIVFWILQDLKRTLSLSWAILAWYQAALLTFMAGSLVSGILELYGTTSPFTNYFWILGSLCIIACIISIFHNKPWYRTSTTKEQS